MLYCDYKFFIDEDGLKMADKHQDEMIKVESELLCFASNGFNPFTFHDMNLIASSVMVKAVKWQGRKEMPDQPPSSVERTEDSQFTCNKNIFRVITNYFDPT